MIYCILWLQIPADGCPVGTEIDIAVDFVAPEYPGRYISYWRMATASGQKFGQRVWVLIEVNGYPDRCHPATIHE